MFTSRPGSCLSSGYHRHNPRTGRSTGKKENRETEEEEEEIRDDLSLFLSLSDCCVLQERKTERRRPGEEWKGKWNQVQPARGKRMKECRGRTIMLATIYNMARRGKTASVRTLGDQGSTRYQAGSVFRMPRARLIARWPRFIGHRDESTTETVFRRSFFAAVIARYRLLIARTLGPRCRFTDLGERGRDENATKRSMWRPTRWKYFVTFRRQQVGPANLAGDLEARSRLIDETELKSNHERSSFFKNSPCRGIEWKILARWSFVNNETRLEIEALRLAGTFGKWSWKATMYKYPCKGAYLSSH